MHKKISLYLIIILSLLLNNLVALQDTKKPEAATPNKKNWTFLVYIAADNDLNYFATRNINDMKNIGSTEHVNVIVQLDGYGIHEKTKRLYIEKNSAIQVNQNDVSGHQKQNSGSAQTLIESFQWAVEQYPADHYALILWNHGSGILDNIRSKSTNASELFAFNPSTHMLELNRSIGFINYIESKEDNPQDRGVCFSDTYGSYLTNEKLDYALETICNEFLDGKKIDIVGFDACLMSMIEVGTILKKYVHYMVGSQEVELGTGWPYAPILKPFLYQTFSPREFAKHIVKSYGGSYEYITNDYTQSAFDLEKLDALEENIRKVASTLIKAMPLQKDYSVKRSIRASRSRRLCTYFSEPSYIDLHHFYSNLIQTTEFMKLSSNEESIKEELLSLLEEGLTLITNVAFSNITGSNLSDAQGVSIYFPTRYIDLSYTRTIFAKTNYWLELLHVMV